MSRLISLFVDGHASNSCFADTDIAHQFNPTSIYRELRMSFAEFGYLINTADVNGTSDTCFDIHVEGRPLMGDKQRPRFLLAYENPLINPLNADPAYYAHFDRVITWNPAMLACSNVDIQMYPSLFAVRQWPRFEDRSIFLSLINANKAYRRTIDGDLYKERLALIRFCESRCPDLFHLYGRGWDKPTPSFKRFSKVGRTWTRLKTKAFGFKPFPSWRGTVSDKNEIYDRCKFAVCFENFFGIDNYITEKIFDAFSAGCVPVYWGAPNIEELIPSGTFIDMRNFDGFEALISHLGSIDAATYAAYQERIREYLESSASDLFDLRVHMRQVARNFLGYFEAHAGKVEVANQQNI